MDELEQQQQQQAQEAQTEAIEQSALDESQASPAPEQKHEGEDVETLKKRLADTQKWAHQLNTELKQRQQQQEAHRLNELQQGLQPEVLSVVDQAIEAREIRQRQEAQRREQQASQAIYEFDPDVERLKDDPVFVRTFEAQCERLRGEGKDPLNPIFAVKAVAEARKQYEQSQARADAQAQEQARKTSKLSAMDVPGSGAAAPPSKGKSEDEQAADVWNMSPAEFAKMKMRARGF